jgi:hypothetical protein
MLERLGWVVAGNGATSEGYHDGSLFKVHGFVKEVNDDMVEVAANSASAKQSCAVVPKPCNGSDESHDDPNVSGVAAQINRRIRLETDHQVDEHESDANFANEEQEFHGGIRWAEESLQLTRQV